MIDNSIFFDISKNDFRVEIIASELIKRNISEDTFRFKSLGGFNRSVSKDIESFRLETETYREFVDFYINREGLYDMLPEALFHFNVSKKKNKSEILDEIKKNVQEEKEARAFFLPFENEFYLKKINLELQNQYFLKFDSEVSNRILFESLYNSFQNLNNSQILCLLYIIPLAHKIRSDIKMIEYCLTKLIGYPITISNKPQQTKYLKESEVKRIGNFNLGVNSVIGDSIVFRDQCFQIKIQHIEVNMLTYFFEKSNTRNFIDCLFSLFLPATYDYELILEVQERDSSFCLSKDESFAYLNYNTHI